MQGNNNLRVFSINSNNRYTDAEINDLAVIEDGPGAGAVADSKLYNSLSLTTTLATVSLIDFIAQKNPSVTFGQTLSINDWISAVNNALISKSEVQSNITSINNAITNITNGTTVVTNALNLTSGTIGGRTQSSIFNGNTSTVNNSTNVVSTINGKQISTIFESNGTTVKNSTNVTGSINGQPISDIFESDGTTVKNSKYTENLSNNPFAKVTTLNGVGGSYEMYALYTYGASTGSYSFGIVRYNPSQFVSISPSVRILSPNNGEFLTLTIDRNGAITVWLNGSVISADVYARKLSS